MIENIRPDVLNPPAIVVQAFDEEKALAECRALIERRDEAKGEYKGALLALGQKLIEARRAMPGQRRPNGTETFSPAFLAFVERCGLSKKSADIYMGFARDPRRLEARREYDAKRESASIRSRRTARRKALQEMLAAYQNGYSADEIFAAIRKELNDEVK